MSDISSKFFLSDLLIALRKGFHSSFSISNTFLSECIVRPILRTNHHHSTTINLSCANAANPILSVKFENYVKYQHAPKGEGLGDDGNDDYRVEPVECTIDYFSSKVFFAKIILKDVTVIAELLT